MVSLVIVQDASGEKKMREFVTDESDQATEREMRDTELAIQVARQSNRNIPSTGVCYNCGETLAGELRWCDRDCRDDWESRDLRTV